MINDIKKAHKNLSSDELFEILDYWWDNDTERFDRWLVLKQIELMQDENIPIL
jgi:hypothetical protein